MEFDLILKNGTVVDPVNGVNKVCDIAIRDSMIVDVSANIDDCDAKESIDLTGKTVVPGLIDTHVHLTNTFGNSMGYKMLAQAGVATALDLCGPIKEVLDDAGKTDVALNLASLHYVLAGETISSTNPDVEELEQFVANALKDGALGIKIIGGHFPVTPECISKLVEVCDRQNAYVTIHAGSTESGSDIIGLQEAVEMARGKKLHIAHINSYCRGRIKPSHEEAMMAIDMLKKNPNIFSESYISAMNGTSSRIDDDGLPLSHVTRTCLGLKGYELSIDGIREAVKDKWCNVNGTKGGIVIGMNGEEGLAYLNKMLERGIHPGLSFPVNPTDSRMALVEARREDGSFVVDAISTDGGGIPRNVMISHGLPLIKLGSISLEDWIIKTSHNPAQMLGLADRKGHLGVGMDADITVIDMEEEAPYMMVSHGEIGMFRGLVTKGSLKFITTEKGEQSAREKGLETLIINTEETSYGLRS